MKDCGLIVYFIALKVRSFSTSVARPFAKLVRVGDAEGRASVHGRGSVCPSLPTWTESTGMGRRGGGGLRVQVPDCPEVELQGFWTLSAEPLAFRVRNWSPVDFDKERSSLQDSCPNAALGAGKCVWVRCDGVTPSPHSRLKAPRAGVWCGRPLRHRSLFCRIQTE